MLMIKYKDILKLINKNKSLLKFNKYDYKVSIVTNLYNG